MELVEAFFSHVCGSENIWVLGSKLLPFCQRCTGLYVGLSAALVVYGVARPRPTPFTLWLHGALLVGMIPFGYHWVPQAGIVRTLTGFLFACGIVYYLLLVPFERWDVKHRWSHEATFAILLMVLVSLLSAVSFGGPLVASVLSWLGFLGLLSVGILSGASALALIRAWP